MYISCYLICRAGGLEAGRGDHPCVPGLRRLLQALSRWQGEIPSKGKSLIKGKPL